MSNKNLSGIIKTIFLTCVLNMTVTFSFSQIISGNAFLKGNFVQGGLSPCGTFGTSVDAPSGYYPRGGSSTPNQLGFISDATKDGWTVGSPDYCGDYFLPGTPEEGWGVQIDGTNYNNNQICVFNEISGSIISYSNSGAEIATTWEGTVAGLTISARTYFSINSLYITTEVVVKNTTGSTLNNVYYMRSLDPDNEATLAGGEYITTNTIDQQNPNAQNTALVSAVGGSFGCYLGLGSKDCRARVTHGGFDNRNASDIWNGTGGLSSSGSAFDDKAISISFYFGNLAPGETATFAYSYIFDPAELNNALESTSALISSQPISQSVCLGQPVTFSVSATGTGLTYQWRKNGVDITGATDSSYTIDTVAISDTGNYDVSVIGICNPIATSDIAVLKIGAPKPADFTTYSPAVCQGQSGVSYIIPNDSTVTYNWAYSGTGATIIGTSDSVTVDFDSSATSGDLSVSASNTCGTGIARTIGITVNSTPNQPLNFTTSSSTVCAGQTGISYIVPFDPFVTYNWSYSGNDVTITNGNTNDVIVDFSVSATSGDLSVMASNACGASALRTLSVIVSGSVPSILSQPSDSSIFIGTNASFSVTATGAGLSYQWQMNQGFGFNNLFDGGVYSNVTTTTMNITGATLSMNGYQYRCSITGTCPPVAISNSAILSVSYPPCTGTPVAGATISTANPACSGQNFSLSLSGSTVASGITHQWQSSSDNISYTNISGATDSFYVTSQSVATYYRCVVTCTVSGLSDNSTPLNVTMGTLFNCYCASTANTSGDEEIFNVTVGSLNNTSNCTTTGGGNSILSRYSDYTSMVAVPDIMQGVTVSFSVEIGTCGGNYNSGTAIFIDYNQNGLFTDAGELAYGTTGTTDGPHFVTGNFTIPINATVGNTLMRVINAEGYDGTNITPCLTYGYGETEDYKINILAAVPCSVIPSPGNTLASESTVCAGIDFSLSIQNIVIESGLSYQWQSSPDGISWINIDSATSSTFVTSLSTSTYYQCIVTCSGFGSATSVPVLVSQNTNMLECYCIPPSSIYSCTYYISNVTIDSINVTSTCSTSYENYSSTQSTSIMQGSVIPVSLSSYVNGFAYNFWLDLNDNGVFELSEIILTIINSTGLSTVTDNLIIPINAPTGQHRLRIRGERYWYGVPTDPCNQLQYGETEDYILNITAAPICSAIPSPGNTLSSVTSACSGIDFTLGIQNDPIEVGLSYQWQFSTDGVTWMDIISASSATLVTNQTDANYYQCVVTCAGFGSIASTPIFISMAGITQCYCIPPVSSNPCVDYISNVTIDSINVTSACSTGTTYEDYSSSQSTSIMQGSVIPISLSSYNYGLAYTLWLDTNDNGVFESNEILLTINNGSNLLTITDNLSIPINATVGSHRLRIRGQRYYNGAPTDPCSQLNRVETEDYTLNIIAAPSCSALPSPGNTLASDSTGCPGTNFTLTIQNNPIEAGLSYQWQSSPDGATWTDISGDTISSLVTNQMASTYYQCIVTCTGYGSTASNPTLISNAPPTQCYCTPITSGSNPCITNVTIDLLNNTTSGCGVGDYKQSATTTLLSGMTYPLSVTTDGDAIISVWIDFNHSGTYDTWEWQQVSLSSTPGVPTTIDILIPDSALSGITGMRVFSRATGNQNGAGDACRTGGSGEAEEYMITIVYPVACSALPSPGNTLSSDALVCPGKSFSLSIQNVIYESGLSYQWQSSPDGITWTTISSATNSSLVTSQTANTYYQCIVTCSGIGSTASAPVLVNINTNILECYCIPPTSTSPCAYTPISNVTIDSINVTTACSSGTSYENFSSSQIISASPGSSLPISLSSSGGAGSAYTIWADLNDNGIFETTEILLTITNSSNLSTVTDSIVIPLTAITGQHRLRIRAEYYQNGAPADPCNQLQYGETEDYSLNIITSCSGLNVALSPVSPKCNGGTDGEINSIVTGGISPYTFSWSNSQTSPNLSGINGDTYSVTVTDSKTCTVSASILLNDPVSLTLTMTGINPACSGSSDGTALTTATGGTGVYNYFWSTGSTLATLSGLSPGTYSVTVTDQNLCTQTGSVIISNTSALTLSINGTNPGCNGESNGSASAIPAGGTSGYSYLWSTGDNTPSINALIFGNYSVTVTDANSCTSSGSVILTNPSLLTVNATGNDLSCSGSADGSALAAGNGGSGTLSYVWSSGENTALSSSLVAGTYTVTVSDENFCTKSTSVSLSAPNALLSSTNGTSPACSGGTDGSASVTASGGFGALSYSWSSGQTSAVINGLSIGTYTTTITDANSCTQTNSITLNQPTLISVTINGTDPSCNGVPNGTASASVSGGTSPLFYDWSNGATGPQANNLSSGVSYNVTVTDANSCSQTGSVTLSQPSIITTTLNGTDPSCNGSSDGSATATASGGTGAFNYSWSNASSINIISNLSAGNFTVTVTDANSCKEIKTITLSDPAGIIISASVVNAACVTSNGSATISSGGAAPFSYSWSNGVTDSVNTALIAGSYTVTVTDVNLCTASQAIFVDNITGPTVTLNATPPNCNGGSDGVIIVNLAGGTAPYAYSWSSGATTSFISGLSGNVEYQVTVTDVNNCLGVAGVILSDPEPISLSIVGTDLICNGGTSGSATVTATGGTGSFSYSWNNGDNTSSSTGLSSANYTVNVTDGNSCTKSGSVSLLEPTALTSNVSGTSPACNGGANGSTSVTVSGGIQPYSYMWSSGQTTSAISGLSAGTYTVTITDANSCTLTNSFIVADPPALSLTVSGTNPACNGKSNGSATGTASGGTGAYFYNWSTGVTNATAANLSAGVLYEVTVTDGKSCSQTGSVLLTEPAIIITSISSSNPACNGQSNGMTDLTVSGGTGTYTYLWSEGQTTEDLSGLTAGTYFVTVTDANACTRTNSVSLMEPSLLTLTVSGTNPSCNGGANGTVISTPGGGTGGYTYTWSAGATTQNLSGLLAGTYTVTVTDAGNCTINGSVTLSNPTAVIVSVTGTNPECNGQTNGSATVNGIGGTGSYTYLWSNAETGNSTSGLAGGNYMVTITDGKSCSASGNITLTNPAAITLSFTITNPTCNGNSNGSAIITAGGGTPGYTYQWSSGQTTATISSMPSSTYTVTVTDAKNCTLFGSATLNEPVAVTVTLTGTDPVCGGGNNGSVTATGAGGTGAFTYLWSNAMTTISISALTAGTYTITATDGNNCTATSNITLTAPPVLTVSVTGTNVNCNTGTKGTASATAGGGTAGYTNSWSTGETSSSVTNLSNGSYTVTVTDAKGCTVSGSATVSVPSALIVTVTGSSPGCNGGSNGTASLTTSGGTPGYTYAWSAGATSQNLSSLSAGTFTVTVTDSKTCSVSGSVTLTNPTVVTASVTGTSPICNGGNNGTATVAGTGGTGTFTYLWSTSATTSTLSTLAVGTYTVTVTDGNSCTATGDVTLTEPLAIALSLSGTNPNCNGGTEGSISTTPSGGAGFYTYKWNGGSTTQNRSGLPAGTYTVTVSDAKNCTQSADIILVEPSAIIISITKTDATGSTASDGTASVTPTGGTSPYSYSWSTIPPQTTSTAINLKTGTYTVTLTDSKGCMVTDTVFIDFPDILTENKFSKNISVYPNPTQGILNIEFGKIPDDKVEIQLIDLTGRLVHRETYKIANATSLRSININQVSNGSYFLIITGEEDVYRMMVKVE